ncbi:MAG: SHOCT domain-containing protein [Burkholderiales bacterium]|nr:SHOCT domain-containing protein [Burkholderiales bacterium]
MARRLTLMVAAIVVGFVASGCANPGIVKLGPDTYMLSRTDKGGVFGNASAMKADVIREANEFAAKQGKVAVPVTLHESPMYIGHFASVEYQFRVVDASDPDAQKVILVPRPDMVIESTGKASVDVKTTDETKRQPDVYSELIKLDDLRKRGILSDAEFEAQKKKLLNSR